MKSIEIKATFKGQNSLGYEHGKEYTLDLLGNSIRRTDGTGICLYSSVQAFLNNWEIKPSAIVTPKWPGIGMLFTPPMDIRTADRFTTIRPMADAFATGPGRSVFSDALEALAKSWSKDHTELKKTKEPTTIKVKVLKAGDAGRWYNDYVGKTVYVDSIISAGTAYRNNCGKKYNNEYGTIPPEHFELVTEGLEFVTVAITHADRNAWYKTGQKIKATIDPKQPNYYLPVTPPKELFSPAILRTDASIIHAKYKKEYFNGSIDSLKVYPFAFGNDIISTIGGRAGRGKTSMFMLDMLMGFEQSPEALQKRLEELLQHIANKGKSTL